MNQRRLQRQLRRGIVYEGTEYWIKISDLYISDKFKKQQINSNRFKLENNYYKFYGLYETRILVDRNFNLVWGYISILVAYENGETVVPVYFVGG